MIIIGEKINGAIPSTAKAIQERDEAFIRDLALRQTEFGADYLDVCAGTSPQLERETLEWLIHVVQDAVDTPLCIDSSDCHVILDMIPLAKRPGMLNSVSEEHGKCEILLPKIADSAWNIVALACDNNGISTDPQVKFGIASAIVEKAGGYGISADRLFIDPLVTTISTTGSALLNFSETLRSLKARYPEIHITSGLSNISFGMPYRKAINQQFLTLAMSAGMDSAIMDPTSDDMRAALYATEALLGQDRNCRKYLQAYRKGLIGPKKK
ncbi:MAG: methyltetrahydrofolate cobalamin methyltransferase [Clostridiales Family XIII bacterium]|jgi:5-methyltetrahydrofolate--homocysteine methyltransferase|nr:methyltetrahydrofolate cobalamin methyltransferase [Clostridiales Family XIII bacterium]